MKSSVELILGATARGDLSVDEISAVTGIPPRTIRNTLGGLQQQNRLIRVPGITPARYTSAPEALNGSYSPASRSAPSRWNFSPLITAWSAREKGTESGG